MSTKTDLHFPSSLTASPAHPEQARDIRDVFSYRIALLARINDRDAQNQLVSRYGITLGEWRTLAVIRYLGTCTLGQLAGEGFLDIGQVSRSVTALVDRGMVDRRADAADRRAVALSLSAAGEDLHGRVMIYARSANAEMLGALTPEEQDQLYRLLDRVMDQLRRSLE
jgi:DNA-binding MarR family transcriptional regulator